LGMNSGSTRRAISLAEAVALPDLLAPGRRGVLITRPLADAIETAAVVAERGFYPVIAPVMTLHQREIAPHGRFDAVVITSRNGVPALAEGLRTLPLLAVGSATATRARQAGFTTVMDAQGDGAALAHLAKRRLDPGSHILFAHGFRQGDALAEALAGSGFSVTRACAYEVTPARRMPQTAIAALEAGTLEAALFLSTETAAAFVAIVPPRLRPALAAVVALAIGQRAADVLAPLPWRGVRVSFKPTLDGVLALL
jgi:uroporphyrinogen-III synthase